jgi:putative FmdB family regulatory protein
MPHYEFTCLACKKKFSVILTLSEYEKGKTKCPKCGSKRLEQRWAAVYAITSKNS